MLRKSTSTRVGQVLTEVGRAERRHARQRGLLVRLLGLRQRLLPLVFADLELPVDREELGEIAAARAIGVSERTLQRATQSTLGMSPIRFVQEARLEQATVLLRTTNQTPAAIALAVGYQDVSTLRTLIRRLRHTTLSALRR